MACVVGAPLVGVVAGPVAGPGVGSGVGDRRRVIHARMRRVGAPPVAKRHTLEAWPSMVATSGAVCKPDATLR